jgi:hypothetical protein
MLVPRVGMAVGTGVSHPVSNSARWVVSRSDFIGLLDGNLEKWFEINKLNS